MTSEERESQKESEMSYFWREINSNVRNMNQREKLWIQFMFQTWISKEKDPSYLKNEAVCEGKKHTLSKPIFLPLVSTRINNYS